MPVKVVEGGVFRYSLLLACSAIIGALVPLVGLPLLAVPLAIGVVLGAALRPDLAVLALVLWLPVEGWVLKFIPGGSIGLLGSDMLAAALTLTLIAHLATKRSETVASNSTKLIVIAGGLLASAWAISWLVNVTPLIDALYWGRVMLRYVPIGIIVSMEPWRTRIARRLPIVILIVASTQLVAGLAQAINLPGAAEFFWPGQFSIGAVSTQTDTLLDAGNRIVAGMTSHPNILAQLLVLCAGFAAGHALTDSNSPKGQRAGFWVVTFLCIAIVVLTRSRQAISMALILVAFIQWQVWRQGSMAQRWLSIAAPIGSFLAAAYSLTNVILPTIERFAVIGDASFWYVEVAKNRGYVATEVLSNIVARAPVFGAGPGSFGSSFGGSFGPEGAGRFSLDSAASSFIGDVGWVSVYAQVGVIGLLGVGVMVYAAAAGLRGSAGDIRLRLIMLSVFLVLVIGMTASTPLIYKPVSVLIWLFLGLHAHAPEMLHPEIEAA